MAYGFVAALPDVIVDPATRQALGQQPLYYAGVGESRLTYGQMDVLKSLAVTPAQLINARLIIREFALVGLPTAVALAAVVNAYAESQLDPQARSGFTPWTGPHAYVGGEDSVGLFMLNARGAGRGMSDEARMNPTTNTRRIIQEVRVFGGPLNQAVKAGQPVTEIAAIFSRDIERPRDVAEEMERRRRVARQILPGIADLPADALPPSMMLLPVTAPWWAYALGGGLVGLLVLGFGAAATR